MKIEIKSRLHYIDIIAYHSRNDRSSWFDKLFCEQTLNWYNSEEKEENGENLKPKLFLQFNYMWANLGTYKKNENGVNLKTPKLFK